MQLRESESGAGFGLGIVAGMVMGAGLALLFAPKAGTELRENLGESMDTLRDTVKQRYREVTDRAGVEFGNLQDDVERATNTVESIGRQAVDIAAEEARAVRGTHG